MDSWSPAADTSTDLPSVLLVEDAEDNREMYAMYLSQSGFRVFQAATAHQALQTVDRERLDVVITDIALPGLDGVDFCREIRQRTDTADLPVIAVTGLTMTVGDVERVVDAGSNVLLFKPCLPDKLVHEIRKLLTRGAAIRERSRVALDRSHRLSAKSTRLQQRASELRTRCERLLHALSEEQLVDRIEAAYTEMPALALTIEQARRLFAADRLSCEIAFSALSAGGVVAQTKYGTFVRGASDDSATAAGAGCT